MLTRDIYKFLDEISPFCLQEAWDNSGLNVGDFNKKINKIYISLDVDIDVINQCEPNSMIIVHHPLIFKPLKNINFDMFPSNLIKELIKKDISLVSLHTNFDKTHLNKYVCSEILGYKEYNLDNFICKANVNKKFDDFFEEIKDKLNLEYKKVVKTKDDIKSFALTTGSGASLLHSIDVDCFITGDIKYHDAMLAKELGISMIDIGHFESEKYFVDILYQDIKNLNLDIKILHSKNPFEYK